MISKEYYDGLINKYNDKNSKEPLVAKKNDKSLENGKNQKEPGFDTHQKPPKIHLYTHDPKDFDDAFDTLQ